MFGNSRRLKKLVLVAVISVSFHLAAHRMAFGYNSLFWGSGNPFSNTGLGPVISPLIVPVFWGDWQEGTGAADDPDVIRRYLDGFAGWVSGVGAPLGYEPVIRQYGVVGANVLSSDYLFAGSGILHDSDVADNLHSWQSQNLLIQNSPTTIFMVFVKGFSSYQQTSACGYHSSNGGTYYAVVPFDGCVGRDSTFFQSLTTHELMEAMTNPLVGTGSLGWVTRENVVAGYPTQWSEGGDQCQGADKTTPHPFDGTPLPFGVVQNFADNTVNACTTWTLSTSPHLGLARTSVSQLEVFYLTSGGDLGHATLSQDYHWSSETIIGLLSKPLVGAPAVVSPAPGRLDVFVRSFGAHNGNTLNHLTKLGAQPWTSSILETPQQSSGLGPPSAVSWGPNRIDVVVRELWDASIIHFWSDDSDNFQSDNLGGNSIGAPVVITRGDNTLDVFSRAFDASPQENSWNASVPAHPNAWSGFSTIGGSLGSTLPLSPVALGPSAANIDQLIHLYVPNLVADDMKYINFLNEPGHGWSPVFQDASTGSSYGAIGVASLGNDSVTVWESRQNAPASAPFQSYNITTQFESNETSTPLSIPGIFMSPPAVLYGSDGYPEIIGIGTDGCLYETWIDYPSGGRVNGPYPIGVCGVQ